MLIIKELEVSVDGNKILKGLNLEINAGEVHAIMGPNGSGKSTLAQVIAGHEDYDIDNGTVEYVGKDLLEMDPEERSCEGVFMAFQYPIEIPGVSNMYFLKSALNAQRKYHEKNDNKFNSTAVSHIIIWANDKQFRCRPRSRILGPRHF